MLALDSWILRWCVTYFVTVKEDIPRVGDDRHVLGQTTHNAGMAYSSLQ